MKYTNTSVLGSQVNILAAENPTAVPFTVTEDAEVKAGYPMTLDGKKATSATANGVLLYDVDPTENPNGALVVAGVIDAVKAASNSGFTYDADAITALKAAVPGVVFRTNIGTNA